MVDKNIMDNLKRTTPLSTLIKSLCDESDKVRHDICSSLSLPITDFNKINVSDVCKKGNNKIPKLFFCESTFKLTNIIDNINNVLNPVFECESLSNALNNICDTNCDIINSQFQSDINSQLATSSVIAEAVDKAMKQHTTDIEQKLSELYTVVSQISVSSLPHAVPPEIQHTQTSDQSIKTEHSETYITKCVNDFINQTEIDNITSALSDSTFSAEHGHSVCAFGADYRYNGSRATTRDFPEPIKELVDKINSKFYKSDDKINSCLVNKYSGNDAFLPEHSDNEYSIDPESSIFTISIGAKADIVFRDISDGTETKHVCESGSLYYMSRHSQDFFTHRINKSDMGVDVRYSLTFRVVGWCFKNSTCVIGDSNTGKLKFGTEKGTFGYTMPGKREWAATISDIDPNCCSSYKNVVILCGINDIKSKHIRNSNDIKELYIQLKCKIEQIRIMNKRANIFVCPILPTKLSELNRKALDFNKCILGDLCRSCPGVSLVLGFDEFLDQDGYLAKSLSFTGDHLHLNIAGARHLATLFKASISLKNGGGGRIKKKPYSAAVSEGTGGDPA